MFTDIVGYTALTETNEGLALKLLDQHRRIVRPLIWAHNGREIKTMGDAFLVEFGSAVEATRCAYEIQGSLSDFNRSQSAEGRILLRIGIHLGDIVHSERDVYGDAVNLASRIEGLAEPGGICVSRQVYDSVHRKLQDMQFESLGAKRMKNVKDDFEVFRVAMPSSGDEQERPDRRIGGDAQPRNRIAVLPFVNIGPDNSDEFFADGLTEELISIISHAKDLRVIARTSAMNYKNDRQRKIRDIGRELGAGTIVEGSVRKAGNRIRVTVQVVNALNEEPLWSETYDRNLDDIFEIQTDIATKVAESFSSNLGLSRAKIRESQEKEETEDIDAYSYFLGGRHLLYGESESSVKQALEFFNKAIELDPNFARAYVGRAECRLALSEFARVPFDESARKAEQDALSAIRIDPELAEAHAVYSKAKYALDEFAAAEDEAKKAIELNPSLADAYSALAHLKWITAELLEGAKLYETAYKLDPLKEENILMLSEIYSEQGREEESLKLVSSIEHLFPQVSYSSMAWYYAEKKKDFAKAREFVEKFKLAAGNDSIYTIALEGVVAAYAGDREKALDAVARLEGSWGRNTPAVSWSGYIYHALGDMDKFFECMNRSMEFHGLPLGNLVNSPMFADARRDPRFAKLLERLDLKIDPSKLT